MTYISHSKNGSTYSTGKLQFELSRTKTALGWIDMDLTSKRIPIIRPDTMDATSGASGNLFPNSILGCGGQVKFPDCEKVADNSGHFWPSLNSDHHSMASHQLV